jgi:hypothetical protein
MRYNVEHTSSRAVAAIAESAGGSVVSDVHPVTSDGTGIAVIEFSAEQVEYIEEMLDADESVIRYR